MHLQSVFDREMKEIKLREKQLNEKYMGITKIKELQSDQVDRSDNKEDSKVASLKRQKIEDSS